MIGALLLLWVMYCPEQWQFFVAEPAAEHWDAAVIPALR